MFMSTKTPKPRAGLGTPILLAVSLILAFLPGCTEPLTSYQVQGVSVAHGQKILVLPFMDTRTFTDSSDPHKYDLGYHARVIFVDAMRPYANGNTIYTPNLPLIKKSLANAEIAELGRRMGADLVVAGQIFSFTDTRAASIPPRAGMFIRVISAKDGSLLFAGDHYQAANVPGGGGGRDGQARKVADLLVQGFLANSKQLVANAGRIASSGAFAMLSPVPMKPAAMAPSITKPESMKHRSVLKTAVDLTKASEKTQKNQGGKNGRDTFKDPEPLPEPPPLPDLSSFAMLLNSPDWNNTAPAPEKISPASHYADDFFRLPPPPDTSLLALAGQPQEQLPLPSLAGKGAGKPVDKTETAPEAGLIPSAAALAAADAAAQKEAETAEAALPLPGAWNANANPGGSELPNLDDNSFFEKMNHALAEDAEPNAANPGDWNNGNASWVGESEPWVSSPAGKNDDVDSWEPDPEDDFPGERAAFFDGNFSEIATLPALGLPVFDDEPLAGNEKDQAKDAPNKDDAEKTGPAGKPAQANAAPKTGAADKAKSEVDKALELTKAIDAARETAKTATAQQEAFKIEAAKTEAAVAEIGKTPAVTAATVPAPAGQKSGTAKAESFATEPEATAGAAPAAAAAPVATAAAAVPAPDYSAYLASYPEDGGQAQASAAASYTYTYADEHSADYSADPGYAALYATAAEPVDTASAACIDELPEIDYQKVDPFMVSADEVYPKPNLAAKITGDQLAGDLIASDGGLYGAAMVMPDPPVIVGGKKDDPIDPGMVYLPLAVTLNGEEYAQLPTQPFVLDPETLEVVSGKLPVTRVPVTTAAAPAARPVPVPPSAGPVMAQPASPVPPRPVPQAVGPVMDGSAGLATAPRRPRGKAEVRGDTVVKVPAVPEAAVTSEVVVRDGTPLASRPLVAEQPRTQKSVDFELQEDPYAEMQDAEARIAFPRKGNPDAARILILPYYDRQNPNNLIANTGGGEVVTTLYGTQLALDPALQVLWDGSGRVTHDRPISRQEALELGRLAKADFVMRGEVVEFRRAQSVPSLFSAVISTAVLAAQVFFAEMSGVDVATEVYRVSDGMCIVSRRDRAQQKYVVQAEKTVRRMAGVMSDDVERAIRNPNVQPMDPLIDELSPVTVLTNPK